MTDILFAEDDAGIREWTALALEGAGGRVRAVADGAAALKAYDEKRPDIVILDVMMPKVSGWDVLTEIRKKDKSVPIMMLTAKAAESDKVTGLGLGADDYLAKPFGVAELRARVAALLRRAAVSSMPAPEKSRTFPVGSRTVDPKRSVVVAADGSETAKRTSSKNTNVSSPLPLSRAIGSTSATRPATSDSRKVVAGRSSTRPGATVKRFSASATSAISTASVSQGADATNGRIHTAP